MRAKPIHTRQVGCRATDGRPCGQWRSCGGATMRGPARGRSAGRAAEAGVRKPSCARGDGQLLAYPRAAHLQVPAHIVQRPQRLNTVRSRGQQSKRVDARILLVAVGHQVSLREGVPPPPTPTWSPNKTRATARVSRQWHRVAEFRISSPAERRARSGADPGGAPQTQTTCRRPCQARRSQCQRRAEPHAAPCARAPTRWPPQSPGRSARWASQ